MRFIFPVERTLLTENLFGMDLNTEAVEIARLSFWIKTAKRGEVLTSLDKNVQQGNSIVVEPDPLTAWTKRFPQVFATGGFDACIGNPPYVRQEWIKADKPFLQEHYKAFDGVADLYVYFYELGLNVLKPGGRLGFIVTNKWMKAGYGEALRTLFGDAAWVESVVDFGHAKQIFPDADVFPSILVARKPTKAKPPAEARVCVIPRETIRIDDLSRQIQTEGVAVPRSRFGAEPWTLEPSGVTRLMEKIKAKGMQLKEYSGVTPYRGIVTGNDAFIVDTKTRDKLISEHSSSNSILKKFLRGQDLDRWLSEWAGEWMIFARRGIELNRYPAVKKHLLKFREQFEPKPIEFVGKNWLGRKPGTYLWHEIQGPVEYWQGFEKPKIVYQEIQFHPCYSLESDARYATNKVFFIPTDDMYLLGVLNSPMMWWHNFRYLPDMKDEALTPAGYKMEELPIAKPSAKVRSAVETAVRKLIAITGERQSGRRAVADWLRVEFGVEKPRANFFFGGVLSADDFVAEAQYHAKKNKKPLSVSAVKQLKQEFTTSIEPLNDLVREADRLERTVSDLVNEAYGLTPEDVKLMWDTAPPRMPVGPPQ